MSTLIHTFAGNIGIGTNDPGSYKLNVNGGVGVQGSLVGANANLEDVEADSVNITDATVSTSKTTGALKVAGGVGVSGALYGANANLEDVEADSVNITDTTASTTKTTGALKVAGGVGISGALFGAAATFDGVTSVTNATASTSKTTGALKVTGGVGIQGALFGDSASFTGAINAASINVAGLYGGNTPIGLISLWYGTVASIPVGWTLCNGVAVVRTDGGGNITPPDLRGRMIRSAHGDNPATNYPGQSGGANSVTLSVGNLAPHTHTANSAAANAPHTHTNQSSGAAHSHYVNASNAPHVHAYTRFNLRGGEIPVTIFHPQSMGQYGSGQHSWVNGGASNAPHAHNSNNGNANHNHTIDAANAPHSHTITVSAAGSGQAVNIENPYHILAYIMKY